ncbi:DUF4249 domain-containing protein [Sphingobacterium sp. InxBP1]|uniref:DUF4249 domain-containing protein n=1 Tax=Sphingobacterium sp. InxBP1 TaxID=2870328 RepID=UPI0022440CE2|nr:DUF4249 domain-containing protein [Sphingobacterium sp. InxBP1]MCW8310795.1 DUF4249 domain-containing protein [Sphingobacterium sp. InxBP1]
MRTDLLPLCFLILFTACEENIDIDLNTADARLVIDAQLTDASTTQRIRISRSVGFDQPINSSGTKGANVVVTDDQKHSYSFQYEKDGYYVHRSFKPVSGRTYTLKVAVQQKSYTATSKMPAYVAVDSTGIFEKKIAGDSYFFVTMTFKDPANVANHYMYTLSVNGKPFRFASTQNDQFNDGLKVTHYISDLETDLSPGDDVVIRRYCVDEKTYQYWNEYQRNNLSNAAPGNPPSNITNGALGYFSVAPMREYRVQIR